MEKKRTVNGIINFVPLLSGSDENLINGIAERETENKSLLFYQHFPLSLSRLFIYS